MSTYKTDFGIIDDHPIMTDAVFKAGIKKLEEILESARANGDVTVTVKCFESEEK